MQCRLCEHSAINKMEGYGTKATKLMIVGEAPGTQEAHAKIPFIGPAGELLNQTLADYGLHRAQVFVTNVCRCQPVPEGNVAKGYNRNNTAAKRYGVKENRKPKSDEIAACLPYLEQEISEIKPHVILTLGDTATKALLGGTNPITEIRGQIFWSDKYQTKIIPTLHPAALLHAQKYRPSFRRDVKLAIDESAGIAIQRKTTKTEVALYKEGQLKEALQAIEDLQAAPAVAVDVETSEFDALRGFLVTLGLSGKEGTAICIRICDQTGRRVWSDDEWGQLHDALHRLLKSPSWKLAHNAKYEMKWLAAINLSFGPNLACTQVMHHYLDMDAEHDLETLTSIYTDMPNHKQVIEDYKNAHPEAKLSYAFIPFEILGPYNGADCDATLRIFNKFWADLEHFRVVDEDGHPQVFNSLEPLMQLTMPALRVIQKTEQDGIAVDWDLLVQRHQAISSKLAKLVKAFHEAAGGPVNPNSPKQLQELFFHKLKLPPQKATATGQSTDDKVLSKLAPLHEAPKILWEYREWSKKHSTYIEGLRDAVLFGQTEPRPLPGETKDDLKAWLETLWDREVVEQEIRKGRIKTDWLIHPQFHMTGTKTGRLSSSNPINGQNMPRGPLIRRVFVSKFPGGCIIEGDLNQGELRIMASESQDATLIGYFQQNADVHRMVASRVYAKPPDEIVKEERSRAKAVTFGVIYGRTAYTIAQEFGWPVEQAEAFLGRFFHEFPSIYNYVQAQHDLARRRGWVKTIFGRIRTIEDITSTDDRIRGHAENQSINAPIQSACSDITLAAAVRIYGELRQRKMRAHLVLTVHDSLLYDAPKEEADEVIQIVKDQMSFPVPGLRVPMAADIKHGDRWAADELEVTI